MLLFAFIVGLQNFVIDCAAIWRLWNTHSRSNICIIF